MQKTTLYDIFVFRRLPLDENRQLTVKWDVDFACERHVTSLNVTLHVTLFENKIHETFLTSYSKIH